MKINRKQTLKQAISSLGYKEYLNDKVVESIKNTGNKNVEVEFFTLSKYVTIQKVLDEYKKRGLIPDPFAVIQYLKENPEFLDKKRYIGVQLTDNRFVTFHRLLGERDVNCGRSDHDWLDLWWFAGVRKSGTEKLGNSVLDVPLILSHLNTLEREIKQIRKLVK